MTDCAHPEPFFIQGVTQFIMVHDSHCPSSCEIGFGEAGNDERAKRVSPERDDFFCKNCQMVWAYHPVIPSTSEFYCRIYPMEKV